MLLMLNSNPIISYLKKIKKTPENQKVNMVCVDVLEKGAAASPLLCSGVYLDESSLTLPNTKRVNCDLPFPEQSSQLKLEIFASKKP